MNAGDIEVPVDVATWTYPSLGIGVVHAVIEDPICGRTEIVDAYDLEDGYV